MTKIIALLLILYTVDQKLVYNKINKMILLGATMPNIYSQRWFIKHMIELGYPIASEDDGQCFGIVAMASQAFLAGAMEEFNTRIDILSQLTREDIVILKAGALGVIICKGGKCISGLEVMAFYDGIQLYQQPKSYPQILPRHSSQDNMAAATYVSPVDSDADSPVRVGEDFCGAYDEKELGIYLQALQTALPCKTALGLSSFNHTINLNYDPRGEEWTLVDANKLPARTFKKGENTPIRDKEGKLLSSEIISAFDAGRATTGFAIFSTCLFSTTSNKGHLEASLNTLAASEQWVDIHKTITIEKAGRQGAFKNGLASIAAHKGNHEIITALANAGGDLDARSENGSTLAHIAAYYGKHEVITALAQAGFDVNVADKDDLTPALIAAKNGYHLVIAALAKARVDLNARNENGSTPAHIAAYYGKHEVITALAKAGVDLNAPDKEGFTPAYTAAYYGNHEVITALAKAGANVNAANKNDVTPALIAAKNGYHLVIAALAEAGADLNARNKHGWTPALIAVRYGHHLLAALLTSLHKKLTTLNEDSGRKRGYEKFASLPVKINQNQLAYNVQTEFAPHGHLNLAGPKNVDLNQQKEKSASLLLFKEQKAKVAKIKEAQNVKSPVSLIRPAP